MQWGLACRSLTVAARFGLAGAASGAVGQNRLRGWVPGGGPIDSSGIRYFVVSPITALDPVGEMTAETRTDVSSTTRIIWPGVSLSSSGRAWQR